jgi:general secretion pathway protein K
MKAEKPQADGTGEVEFPEPAGADRTAQRGGQRGFALLLVLWTVLILALLAAGTLDTSRTDLNLARNLVEATRAELLAEGAANVALYGLLNTGSDDQAWRSDGSVYAWRGDGAELRARVTEEGGRIDLNQATPEVFVSLFAAAGVEIGEARGLAVAIAVFRDPDGERRRYGAEDADYDASGRLLGAKDAPFETMHELLRVPGMTAELYSQVAPAFTIFTERDTPDAESSVPLVAASQEGRVLAAAREIGADMPPAGIARLEEVPLVLVDGTAGAGTSRGLYRIEAEARIASGTLYALHAVVRLQGGRPQPYRVLFWGRGEQRLFPDESVVPPVAP